MSREGQRYDRRTSGFNGCTLYMSGILQYDMELVIVGKTFWNGEMKRWALILMAEDLKKIKVTLLLVRLLWCRIYIAPLMVYSLWNLYNQRHQSCGYKSMEDMTSVQVGPNSYDWVGLVNYQPILGLFWGDQAWRVHSVIVLNWI